MTGKETRELLPIAGGRETWQWLRSELVQRKLQSFLVVAVSDRKSTRLNSSHWE